MSAWHRHNPELYEEFGEPDWFYLYDAKPDPSPKPPANPKDEKEATRSDVAKRTR